MNSTSQGVENKTARKFVAFIDEFRKLNPEIQAQQISLFLNIVAQPDLTVKEYAERAGLGLGGPISRNIDALSESRKVVKNGVAQIEKGHGLVQAYEDALDRRYKRVKPTKRGLAVYETLVQLLGK